LILTPNRREFLKYAGVGAGAAAFLAGKRDAKGQSIFRAQNVASGGSPNGLLITSSAAVASGAATAAGVDTTGATLIVLGCTTVFSMSPPTDSKSNTWTQVAVGAAHNTNFSIFFCFAPTVGAGHTFTLPSNGSGYNQTIVMAAFSGAGQSGGSARDGGHQSTSGTPPTPAQAGAVTPTVARDIVISLAAIEQGTGVPNSPDSGFTVAVVAGAGTGQAVSIAYLFQNSAAAVNPLWTLGLGNLYWGVINQPFFGT
jgi:hypothetical protein